MTILRPGMLEFLAMIVRVFLRTSRCYFPFSFKNIDVIWSSLEASTTVAIIVADFNIIIQAHKMGGKIKGSLWPLVFVFLLVLEAHRFWRFHDWWWWWWWWYDFMITRKWEMCLRHLWGSGCCCCFCCYLLTVVCLWSWTPFFKTRLRVGVLTWHPTHPPSFAMNCSLPNSKSAMLE